MLFLDLKLGYYRISKSVCTAISAALCLSSFLTCGEDSLKGLYCSILGLKLSLLSYCFLEIKVILLVYYARGLKLSLLALPELRLSLLFVCLGFGGIPIWITESPKF